MQMELEKMNENKTEFFFIDCEISALGLLGMNSRFYGKGNVRNALIFYGQMFPERWLFLYKLFSNKRLFKQL